MSEEASDERKPSYYVALWMLRIGCIFVCLLPVIIVFSVTTAGTLGHYKYQLHEYDKSSNLSVHLAKIDSEMFGNDELSIFCTG
jgi:hypothetical protein